MSDLETSADLKPQDEILEDKDFKSNEQFIPEAIVDQIFQDALLKYKDALARLKDK